MHRSTNPQRFLQQDESLEVRAAIEDAEKRASAEVKLIVVRHCWGDIRDKARKLFCERGLERTKQRNAVLILLVTTNQEFLVYGDEGIHEHVGQQFWETARDTMAGHFKHDRFGEGLAAGIRLIGEQLATHFPRQTDDANEIDDEIEYEG